MITTENAPPPPGLARLGQTGTLIAVVGFVLLAIGLLTTHNDPAALKNLMQSYLYGWVLAMLPSLGCYGFMLLHFMSRGSWGKPVIRLFEAGAKTLPVMLVLFLPVIIFSNVIYPWANPGLVKMDATLQHRAAYLNPTMFAIRTFGYFGVWGLFTYILTNLSKRQDETGDVSLAVYRQKHRVFCAPLAIHRRPQLAI